MSQVLDKSVVLCLSLIALSSAVKSGKVLIKSSKKSTDEIEALFYSFVLSMVPFLLSIYFLYKQKNMMYRLVFLMAFGLMFYLQEMMASKTKKDNKFDKYFEDFRFFVVALSLLVGFSGLMYKITKK